MAVAVRDHGAGEFEVELGSVKLAVGPRDADDRPRATDLLAASLAVCTAGTIRAFAEASGMTGFEGVDVTVETSTAAKPQRVDRLELSVVLRGTLDDKQVAQLTRAGGRCKIHQTLHTEPTITLAVSRA